MIAPVILLLALWTAKQLKGVKEKHPNGHADAVVLVDCRPSQSVLDILIVPASNEVMTITLSNVRAGKKLAKAIGQRVMGKAWAGFSP